MSWKNELNAKSRRTQRHLIVVIYEFLRELRVFAVKMVRMQEHCLNPDYGLLPWNQSQNSENVNDDSVFLPCASVAIM
jgi:hypothetical protein